MNIPDRGFYASLNAAINAPPQRFHQTVICYDTHGHAKKITTCNSITRGLYWLRSKIPGLGYKDVRVLNTEQKQYLKDFVVTQPTQATIDQMSQVFFKAVNSNNNPGQPSFPEIVRELCQIAELEAPLPFFDENSEKNKPQQLAEKIRNYLDGKSVSSLLIVNMPKTSIAYGVSDTEVYIKVVHMASRKAQHYYIDQNGGMQKATAVDEIEQPRETCQYTEPGFQDIVDLVIANMG